MVTIERPRNHSKTGLFVAWGVTLFATLALGLVIAAAPLPYLTDSASSPTAAAAP